MFEDHPGQTSITLVLPNGPTGPKMLVVPMKVNPEPLLPSLQRAFGLPAEALTNMVPPLRPTTIH
jgi:hypothetical protein